MAFLECGISLCSQSTYKTVRMVACHTDVLVPVCKYHYDMYYNEIEVDSFIEESNKNIKEDFRILWSQVPVKKIDWHLHVPFMEACRQNFSFNTWIQRTKDVGPYGCWSEEKVNLFWKMLGV